ncbi:MAG TPA: tRNA lysidine(34) synthetase TilS [Terriglobia bacterium]|nr:tRNA lysidine(34) synthetase TilS [Terriglobia bacterium]
MIVRGDRVLVGVSGGADSVCLALVLKELGFQIGIAHVNHGLRGNESDEDERFTATLAQRLGVPYFARRVLLMGGNVEAAGRDARRDFLAELVAASGFTKIALAHTENDRVETFFLNLLRGSGPEGLVSMAAVSGRIVRPLIEVSRTAVEAYLRERNHSWRDDASNLDLTFARNRLRHDVIPRLIAEFNPNLIETLTRTVEIFETEDAWTRALTDDWISKNGTNEGDDFVIQGEKLAGEPLALIRRVIRQALREAGSDLQNVSFEHIEAVRSLLEPGKSGKRAEIPGGLQVDREFDRLVFRTTQNSPVEYEYQLQIPGLVHIPELRKVFRAELVESEIAESEGERVFVDADSIGAYVRIRNWKPGDYYRPVGLPAGKLKKLFQRARIPRSHRTSWPVIVADSTIIWVASFPVSREFAPRGRSQKIVAIEASEI